MKTEEQDIKPIVEEVILQGDGTAVIPGLAAEEPVTNEAKPATDERVAKADDESADEEQGHAEETAEEAEARKERNRQRRAQNKERRKEYIESLKRELASRDTVINEMNQRLAVVERKSSGTEMAQLEQAEKETVQFYNHFKQLSQQAIEQADGKTATEAQEKMFALKQRHDQIQALKKAMNTSQQPTQRPLDPRLQANATEWMSRTTWYSPDSADEDSELVRYLDNQLAQKGWDPTTKEYWTELDTRIKKHLPHRYNSSYNSSQGSGRQSAPSPVAAVGGNSNNAKSAGYVLSADRVQAMKDAGIWDDPKQRADMIRRYQQTDKENRA